MIYAIIDAADILEIAGKFPCDIAFEFPETRVFQQFCCKEPHRFKIETIAVSIDATEAEVDKLYLTIQGKDAPIFTEKPEDWMKHYQADIYTEMC